VIALIYAEFLRFSFKI